MVENQHQHLTSPRKKSNDNRIELPDRVGTWYYKHGLFLSSYPTCASGIAVIVMIFSCYPLLNIPLPGTIPTKVVLPYSSAVASAKYDFLSSKNFSIVKNFLSMNNITFEAPFPWAQSKPFIYIQQISMRSSIIPWTDDMQLTDAFRAPLYEVFKLLEIVRNHEDSSSQQSLNHICLHVGSVKRTMKENVFPEYNCLILSPANIWKQNVQNFKKDSNILNTIFQFHNFQKTKVSTAELLFGLPMQNTGIKRYPIRSRSRIIQYTITLVLKESSQSFIESLKQKLTTVYPLYQNARQGNVDTDTQDTSHKESVTYVYYPSEFRILEFMPITTAFILLFVYVYFSVRKIDIVRSRIVLALSAVLTSLSSLMMSLGLCFFFGLTISSQSKGIFPYLVILVGLENCLVITKSIVTTDETFDVKIRIAKGLSKEGWSISKTLLTEITILTIGLATFVPVIQEFCIFAIVGLISDFFIQMLFFSTVLAIDIKNVEYTDASKRIPKIGNFTMHDAFKRNQNKLYGHKNFTSFISPTRSRSHPKLHGLGEESSAVSSSLTVNNHHIKDKKIPKRLKLVNFWARTRFFQRAFMIWMIVWISSIVYNSGFLHNFFIIHSNATAATNGDKIVMHSSSHDRQYNFDVSDTVKTVEKQQKNFANLNNDTKQSAKLEYPEFDMNSLQISNFHWSTILKQYNISLSGKYVTILPTIKLSYAIKPEDAVLLRHPDEKSLRNFQWKALAAALDPLDFSDDEPKISNIIRPDGIPLYPKSPMEIMLTIMLCAISVFVLTYTMVVFYRCICTRNYAEWRSSWNDSEVPKSTERIIESVPVQIKGHRHRIECLVSDGLIVVSSCLKGQISVWDTKTGELLSNIDRMKILANAKAQQQIQDLNVIGKSTSPIWCLDYLDNIVAVGCANGRLEFWEVPAGNLKCIYEEEQRKGSGITNIHLSGNKVVLARLSGRLDFLKMETYYEGKQIDWGFTSAYRRTHVRSGSTGSIASCSQPNSYDNCRRVREEFKCSLVYSRVAHQQPITCMEIVNEIVFTGSQDHTLKVYSLENTSTEYTLHGHCGPITCIFIDPWQHGTGGSGSQEGLLCVWDLLTGACMYSIQAHDGAITSLVCAPSYVISLGVDERLCVWERFQGNLLNNINVTHAYSSLLMLTPSLLVTSKTGSLIVWDVRTGEPTHEVKLDCANLQYCPKIMLLASNSVICDYGNQIRIVRFPMVIDKRD